MSQPSRSMPTPLAAPILVLAALSSPPGAAGQAAATVSAELCGAYELAIERAFQEIAGEDAARAGDESVARATLGAVRIQNQLLVASLNLDLMREHGCRPVAEPLLLDRYLSAARRCQRDLAQLERGERREARPMAGDPALPASCDRTAWRPLDPSAPAPPPTPPAPVAPLAAPASPVASPAPPVAAPVAPNPAPAPEAASVLDRLRLEYEDLTPEHRRRLDIPPEVAGVVVRAVAPRTPLHGEGVRAGDLIVEVDGQPVADARRFEERVRAARPGSDLRLFVHRYKGRDTRFLAVVPVP